MNLLQPPPLSVCVSYCYELISITNTIEGNALSLDHASRAGKRMIKLIIFVIFKAWLQVRIEHEVEHE